MIMTNTACPSCGYPNLTESPYKGKHGEGNGSLEICPSCGFQFGYTDHSKRITHGQWREQWIENGMPWDGIGIKPPPNWNPKQQLLKGIPKLG